MRSTLFSRRETLLSVTGLLFLVTACRSGPNRTDLLDEAVEAVRSRITDLARDPEEAERLLAIYAELEEIALEYVNGHIVFALEADRLMKDRSVASEEIRGEIEVNVQQRLRLDERLLYQQDRLKKNLGRERWVQLVTDLNDAERMERVLGRRG